MTPRRKRMASVAALLATMSLATIFGLRAGEDLKLYFYDPSQIAAGEVSTDGSFRLGGMVKEGTFVRMPGSLEVQFVVTDFAHDVAVRYTGLLPDLFREGQGVVAEGKLNAQQEFIADSILAKHDENYMPPEVAEALKNKPVGYGTNQNNDKSYEQSYQQGDHERSDQTTDRTTDKGER